MKKNIENIAIAMLLILLIVSFLLNMKMAKQVKKTVTNSYIFTSYKELKKENLMLEVLSCSSTPNDLFLATAQEDTIKFCDIPRNLNGYRLIFRCDKNNCESCMREISSRLKQKILNDSINGSVIIIGKYNTINDIRVNKNNWGINEVYSIANELMHDDRVINKPHFYIIDENNCVKNVFIPNAYDANEIDSYLNSFSILLRTQRNSITSTND